MSGRRQTGHPDIPRYRRAFGRFLSSFFVVREGPDGAWSVMSNGQFASYLSEHGGKAVYESAVRQWRKGATLPAEIDPVVEIVDAFDKTLSERLHEIWQVPTSAAATSPMPSASTMRS